MKVSYIELKTLFKTILLQRGFSDIKAAICAEIFAGNSRDGVLSHGLNRFPVFIERIRERLIDVYAEPKLISNIGMIEQWDGHFAPGMYNAHLCMQRAIELARTNGIGCVAIKNTNHWMRGGTYGWQAADNNCIAICATNTRANMPPWGGATATLGNNPLVIAVPRASGHVVMDMALSQFSYGKLQEYELANRSLPVDGGYDDESGLTNNPATIIKTKRSLPIGFWKGSGLSILLDLLVTGLSGGRSVAQITREGKEYGVSQFFICMDARSIQKDAVEEILAFTKESMPATPGEKIFYPGEQTLMHRVRSEKEGIEVDEIMWKEVRDLLKS